MYQYLKNLIRLSGDTGRGLENITLSKVNPTDTDYDDKWDLQRIGEYYKSPGRLDNGVYAPIGVLSCLGSSATIIYFLLMIQLHHSQGISTPTWKDQFKLKLFELPIFNYDEIELNGFTDPSSSAGVTGRI